MEVEKVREHLVEVGQAHLLEHWEKLTEAQRNQLLKDVTSIDFTKLATDFNRCRDSLSKGSEKLDASMEPLAQEYLGSVTRSSATQLKEYEDEGRM